MSIQINAHTCFKNGKPFLNWKNRLSPFMIATVNVAHSGKVAMVKTAVSGLIGAPMTVEFRIARKTHISGWLNYVNSNPFATTTLVDYFVTGRTVVFNPQTPIAWENEIIKDWDIDQTIFDSTHQDYRKGFDLWKGVLNLIIVT